ncbi:Pkinase domain-containing protein [Melia azedarach]|uniref:Pkinase domain-containing protein n=1 Tax=Melia azedarach TaxID=155640 RepID=A0ACC1WSH2_MELAZ|nr:Pkinase domain-containing protein [Melia azedarach]
MQDSGNACKFSNDRGQSSSFINRKLTRLRKLRHVSDDEVGFPLTDRSISSSCSPDSARKSPSPCGSDHWSSSAVPKPLPLPEFPFLRRPESSSSSPGRGFGSPEERSSRGRKSTNHTTKGSARFSSHFNKGDSQSLQVETVNNDLRQSVLVRSTPTSSFPSPAVSPPRSKFPNLTPLNNAKSLSNRRRGFSHDLNIECANYNLRLDVSPKSAPTSVFSSPAVSPQRSKTGDLFSSFWTPQEIEAGSTAEVLDLGRFAGSMSPVSPVKKTVYSAGHSPIQSPTRQSLPNNLRSPNKLSFSVHHKSVPQNSKEFPESNSHVNAHPLPLPPGALSSPKSSMTSATMHHIIEKPSVSLMKSQWQKGKLIGRGTFGSVYIATHRETGATCAMKEVDIIPDDPKSAECIKQLEQEIKVLQNLNHQNIVQYYGSEVVDDHFYIYLEYVHPGPINKYIREHCGAITESIVRNFTRHILIGLAYLHSTMTIHRDIKGANLLVDAKGVVKLADFGMAKHLTGLSYELSLKGSPYWMAPEVMQAMMQKDANPNLALAVDIWSLGCTIIEMLTGKAPWSELEGPQAMFKVLHKTPTIPETLSSEGKDFLQLCFRRKPAERPSAAKLLEHPFVRNSNDKNVSVCKQAFSKLNMMDKSYNSVDRATHKIDLMPNSPDTQIRYSKMHSTSETCQRCYTGTLNCATASHHSPCSTHGVNISLSTSNSHNFSPSSNVSSNMPHD